MRGKVGGKKERKKLVVVCCSVAQSCPTLCNPMNFSKPASSVFYYIPGYAQTHVHWVGDAIQLSHSLPLPSLAVNLSQHQGVFQWVNFPSGRQSIVVSVLVLPVNIQCWFPLGLTGLISLQSKGLTKFLLYLICTSTVYIFLWYIVEHLLFKIC